MSRAEQPGLPRNGVVRGRGGVRDPRPLDPGERRQLVRLGRRVADDIEHLPPPHESGVADFAVNSEEECIALIRNLLSFVPQNNLEDPPFVPSEDPADRQEAALRNIIPENPKTTPARNAASSARPRARARDRAPKNAQRTCTR